MSNLISLHQLDILLIQETKMEEAAFLHVSQKFWKKGGKAAISSRGASEALEIYGMTRNTRLLTPSTVLAGSSPC